VALLLAGAPMLRAQPVTMPDFADLVERTAPAVVNIRTAERVSTNAAQGPQMPGPDIDENDPFYDFFHRFFPQQAGPRAAPEPDAARDPTAASARCRAASDRAS
jgi:serine protease Do